MVAVFQASLKLVREKAEAQLSNKHNKCSKSQGSYVYVKDAIRKMMH